MINHKPKLIKLMKKNKRKMMKIKTRMIQFLIMIKKINNLKINKKQKNQMKILIIKKKEIKKMIQKVHYLSKIFHMK